MTYIFVLRESRKEFTTHINITRDLKSKAIENHATDSLKLAGVEKVNLVIYIASS